MRILLCHNYYRMPGGEDRVFEDELELLQRRGHEVRSFTRHNDELDKTSKLTAARNALWNSEVYSELTALASEFKPDVAHFTNTFPILSPAAYWAIRERGVAVVQSLHNYRMICPGSILMRNGEFCDKCVGRKLALPAIRHGCYRGSRMMSTVTTMSNYLHHWIGTWRDKVDLYVALTAFSRKQFVAGGILPEKIVVKPNFVLDVPQSSHQARGDYFLFVGRLDHEKGIKVLLEAWNKLSVNIPLRIVGSGDMESDVLEHCRTDDRVKYLGQLPHPETMEQIADARAVVIPSTSVETFGRSVIEAYACGTPVVASNIGSIAENIIHKSTGFLVPPNDAQTLADAVIELDTDPALRLQLARQAREVFDKRFSVEATADTLEYIYQTALDRRHGSASVTAPMSHADSRQEVSHADVGAQSTRWPPKVSLFGLRLSETDYQQAVDCIRTAVRNGESATVSCHAAHAVVEFSGRKKLATQLNEFEMITPDGQPVRWAMNLLHGSDLKDRVYGPKLMARVCEAAATDGTSLFLYGGSQKTLDLLEAQLGKQFPELKIAGKISPPFRELTADESVQFIRQINESGAGILFVGLGCPKQDLFVLEHKRQLRPVQICVGAAFDFHARQKPFAPAWMQRYGLEWLFRLVCEPRRLFMRYLVTNPLFVWRVSKQLLFGVR